MADSSPTSPESRDHPPADLLARSCLPLFATRVGDLVRRPPVTTGPETDLRRAAELMHEHNVGSLLILADGGGAPAGIVTDKDLRRKVVAQGLNYNWPVREIMSAPVRLIGAGETCFDALLLMMKHQIHHLPVADPATGRVLGLVTAHDILLMQGSSPYALSREIEAEHTFEGLHALSSRIPGIIRPLLAEGAKAGNVGRLIAVLNESILERLLRLLLDNTGGAPAPFCWLVLGSEGRREQSLRTDQDNALLYLPPDDPAEAARAREFFLSLGKAAIGHLVASGFPECPAKMMASNPRWNLALEEWARFFDDVVERPEPSRVLHATIFFDFRPAFGELELGAKLKREVCERASRNGIFLRFLAQDCLRSHPPLGLFGRLKREGEGPHKGRIDLKAGGVLAYTDFARLCALRLGSPECNTLERLRLARQGGLVSEDFYQETRESFEALAQIRLEHQLRLLEEGKEPDNYLDPSELTALERGSLTRALEHVRALHAHVREEFHLQG